MGEVTLTVDQARDWIKSRTYKLRLDMAATERALLEERAMTAYLTQQRDRFEFERDELAAEVASLRGGCSHVQPHER